MDTLAIFLFGQARVLHPGNTEAQPIARGLYELFAYLLLERKRQHKREVLADLLWGERDGSQARSCLSTALWRLRRILEPPGVRRGTFLVATGAGGVGFNCDSDYWLDVAEFEERVNPIVDLPIGQMAPAHVARLEEAVALCDGEILDGVYGDWALRERERLNRLYLNALHALMSYHRHHERYNRSLHYGHQILARDPLREEVHRAVIGMHAAVGDRGQAVRQYRECCRMLAEELGVPPMDETQALYQAITASRLDPAMIKPAGGGAASRPELYQQLRQQLGLIRQDTAGPGSHRDEAERIILRLEAMDRLDSTTG